VITPSRSSSRSFEHDDTGATLYIKVRGAPEQAIPSIRRLVRPDHPRLPIVWLRTLDDQVNRSLTTERLLAALSGSFGALALLLSLIGLYGVMFFVVTRGTREIGIRLALGATGASAIRLVLRDAVIMIAFGMGIALPCVAALGKLVESQLFGVTATDPATIAAAAVVLAAGALAAAFIPAWRASNVSPTDALRLEWRRSPQTLQSSLISELPLTISEGWHSARRTDYRREIPPSHTMSPPEWQRFTAFPDLDHGQMTRHSVTVLTSHSGRLSIHSDV
jgi:hypothetical protein